MEQNTLAKIIDHNGYRIEIHYDQYGGESPRQWDNAGTMAIFHRRYDFGDKLEFSNTEDLDAYLASGDCYALPIYMYDHGGVTISTNPFSCGWDSGQVGYIYMSKEKAREEAYTDPLAILENEVTTMDSYLRGEVFGYVVYDAEGQELDSCWGYLGDMKWCIEEAKSVANYYERTTPKQYELDLA
jgi:hypothetical protein